MGRGTQISRGGALPDIPSSASLTIGHERNNEAAAESNHATLRSWNARIREKEEEENVGGGRATEKLSEECKTCAASDTDDDVEEGGGTAGVVGTSSPDDKVKEETTYGLSCKAWHAEDCSSRGGSSGVGLPGLWCCKSWCYVSKECDLESASSSQSLQKSRARDGRAFSYEACIDDLPTLSSCPWTPKGLLLLLDGEDVEGNGAQIWHRDFDGTRELPKVVEHRMIDATPWLTAGNLGDGMETGGTYQCYSYAVLVTLFLIVLKSQYQLRLESLVDNKNTLPNDFSVLVSGLPPEANDEERIRKWFQLHALRPREGRQAEVLKVVIGWDIGELKDKLESLKAKQKERVQKAAKGEPTAALEAEIKEINEWLQRAAPNRATDLRPSGFAVVTFRHQRDLRACLQWWDNPVQRVLHWWEHCTGGLCCGPTVPKWEEMNAAGGGGRPPSRLRVVRAPNPPDLRWQDLGRSWADRWGRALRSYAIMSLLVGICLGLNASCKRIQQGSTKEETYEPETNRVLVSSSSSGLGLSSFAAFGTVGLNILLTSAGKRLTNQEYHRTLSSQEASRLMKLTFGMVINTSMVLLLVNWGVANWYLQGGLVTDLGWMLTLNVVLPTLLGKTDLPMRVKRRVAQVEFAARLPHDRYLALWEPSELDTVRRYANALKIFISCMIYTPLIPPLVFVGLFGIGLQYWMDKHQLLRHCKRPANPQGPEAAFVAMRIVRIWLTLGLPVATMVFLPPSYAEEARGAVIGFGVATLILALGCLVVPLGTQRLFCLVKLCTSRVRWDDEDAAAEVDYFEAQHPFLGRRSGGDGHGEVPLLERIGPWPSALGWCL